VPIDKLDREIKSCDECGSSVRYRSVMYLLGRGLYHANRRLSEFKPDKSIRGVGLSDWFGYAERLEPIFDYSNTYYHQEPRLDITAPQAEMLGKLDFLISSDVFEHVLGPIQRAFDSAFALLKPGGHMVFTVPFVPDGRTEEHYPNARDYRVVNFDDRLCVVTLDDKGSFAVDSTPIFHGGGGQTLELRCFGERDLQEHLTKAGFSDISVLQQPVPAFGLYFPLPWSLPILTRKPK
jgi:SAM-dependent methyltransferase